MTERITWERCPDCGELAAVGWAPDGAAEVAVEFDCPNDCAAPQPLSSFFTRRPGD